LLKECKIHGLVEFKARTKRGKPIADKCRLCAIDAVNKRRKKMKLLAIEYLGGKCSICGYSKCASALDFHHKEGQKDFGIGSRGTSLSWEKNKKELDKCQLLCANCHRETHANITKAVNTGLEEQLQKEIESPIIKKIRKCKICDSVLNNDQRYYCSAKCQNFGRRKVSWPSIDELAELLKTKSNIAIGVQFGVSDNAVKKWAKQYGIYKPRHKY